MAHNVKQVHRDEEKETKHFMLWKKTFSRASNLAPACWKMFSRGFIITITMVFLGAAAFGKSNFPTLLFETCTGTKNRRPKHFMLWGKTFSRPSNLASACWKMFSRGTIIITTAFLVAAAFMKNQFSYFSVCDVHRDDEKQGRRKGDPNISCCGEKHLVDHQIWHLLVGKCFLGEQ